MADCEALLARVDDPRVIAAAWDAWRARHKDRPIGRLGPGPGFREAIAAGLRALLKEIDHDPV